MINWISIDKLNPSPVRPVLLYRPLASKTRDPEIAVKNTKLQSDFVWPETVPFGENPNNYTDGACWPSHYAELSPPEDD